jgi:hypothetical protein
MKKAICRLWKQQESRELLDPVYHEQYCIYFEKEKIFFVSFINEIKKEEVFTNEKLVAQKLEPLYERFQSGIDDYLENVFASQKVWRFFDVNYGLDIRVNRQKEEPGWEVWMGEDLSFLTLQHREAREYVLGLITKGECWFQREAKKEMGLVL